MREGITTMSTLTATFNWIAAAIESMKREAGQGLIEYTLIAALISVVAIAAMIVVGTNVTAVFTDVSGKLAGAV
jgi:Flp pilus assembly pilin Flp